MKQLLLTIRLWVMGTLLTVAAMSSPKVLADTKVWLDFDPACGHRDTADVDDCLALFPLVESGDVSLIGISTVFGNANLDVTQRTAIELLSLFEGQAVELPPVIPGAKEKGQLYSEATQELINALEVQPLTVLALGPLTNVAAALARRPDLAGRVERIIAVMGKREGHLFHPSEGSKTGLFGHGPIFSDFNFEKDKEAVEFLLSLNLPLTLIPYELARQTEIQQHDIDQLAAQGEVGAWMADRSRGWLQYWSDFVGREGFYPFDLLASIYLLSPDEFSCSTRYGRVDIDRKMGWFGGGPKSLLISEAESADAVPLNFCHTLTQSEGWRAANYLQ